MEGRIEFLAEQREPLPVIIGTEPPVGPFATLDNSKESVLGLNNCIEWQESALDTVDDLLRLKKELQHITRQAYECEE